MAIGIGCVERQALTLLVAASAAAGLDVLGDGEEASSMSLLLPLPPPLAHSKRFIAAVKSMSSCFLNAVLGLWTFVWVRVL